MVSPAAIDVRRERADRRDRPVSRGALDLAGAPTFERERRKPYVTLCVAGPLDGAVALTSTDSAEVIVEASWGRDRRHRISAIRHSERAALLLADTWADRLVDGHEPTASPRLRK